jgi:DNA-binding transcriptional MerR regulator
MVEIQTRVGPRVGAVVGEKLLRIGELAARAGVSTRTVDFYTGRGLLSPAGRSGGNFRLYDPSDVERIAAIRQMENQGIRLDEITHALTTSLSDEHTQCADPAAGPCPADPLALEQYLNSLDEQVHSLRETAAGVDDAHRGAVGVLVARAHVLIATALSMSTEILPVVHLIPPI